MAHSALHGLTLMLLLQVTGCAGPQLRKVYTEHLGQLTGTDRHVVEQTGVTGTDLGVSFVDPGDSHHLLFLFGDSWARIYQRTSQDSAAWVHRLPLPNKQYVPKINWFTAMGEFIPVKIPHVNLGGMNVPVEGLNIGDKTYIFATTGWNDSRQRHCCSVLSHTEGAWPQELERIVLDHSIPSDKFINISAFVQDDTVWIFGSGAFRQSSVYLAKASPSQLFDRTSWQYYRGMRGSHPEFGADEISAQPLIDARCVGELSVRRHPELGYLMLYNCNVNGSQSHGVYLGRAGHPWGPWDAPINIFNPDVDEGYGIFLHQKVSHVGFDDGLAEPGLHHVCMDCPCHADKPVGHEFGWREECWGGVYGPYLVPEWFSTTSDGFYSIVYTLSSWVPYQVHLVRTVLSERNDQTPQALHDSFTTHTPGSQLVNPGFSDDLHGWQSQGDRFDVFQDHEGRSRLTTYTREKGGEATGTLFQDFTVDGSTTKALGFWVHGGDASVRLYRGVDIVRETRGRSGHEPRRSPETKVCWQLNEYAGETLRVAVFDDKKEDWGFIGVGSFQFLTTCSQLE